MNQPHGEGPCSLEQQGNVLERRTTEDVLQIVAGFVLGGMLIPQAVHLSESGYAGFRLESLAQSVLHLARESFRARSD